MGPSSAANGGSQRLFSSLPRCKKANLMTANEAVADSGGPRSFPRGRRGPNWCVGQQGRSKRTAAVAILNLLYRAKSLKSVEACLHLRIEATVS